MTDGPRSVKIDQDERGGWSSDRPRPGGGRPERPADIGVRCRVLAPTDRLRYTPGSLVVLVGGTHAVRDRFAERVLEDRGALLSHDRVRSVLTGRVPDSELDAKAAELLAAAAGKRLEAGQSTIVAAVDATPEWREPFARTALSLPSPSRFAGERRGCALPDRRGRQDHAAAGVAEAGLGELVEDALGAGIAKHQGGRRQGARGRG